MNLQERLDRFWLHDQSFSDQEIEPMLAERLAAIIESYRNLPLEFDAARLQLDGQGSLVDSR